MIRGSTEALRLPAGSLSSSSNWSSDHAGDLAFQADHLMYDRLWFGATRHGVRLVEIEFMRRQCATANQKIKVSGGLTDSSLFSDFRVPTCS
jgi:hypothetical protein